MTKIATCDNTAAIRRIQAKEVRKKVCNKKGQKNTKAA